MKAPDFQKIRESLAGSPFSAAFGAIGSGARLASRAVRFLGRLFGKCLATVWRLGGALESALGRGFTLVGKNVAAGLANGLGIFRRAVRDLFDWLPSNSGRAYSAFSGIVLILALLWIVDELRGAAARETLSPKGALAAPIDINDPILARVDGRYVHLSEVASAARAAGALQPGENLSPGEAFKRDLVSSYVEQRLLARAATESGLHKEPDVARRLAAARDRILAAAFMEDRLAETVTDDAVKTVYDRNVDATRLGAAVKCRHIVVASEDEARAILQELAAGADFADIARARSLDRVTAPQGGETGYLTREQMTPVFADAAFSTAEGEIAPLFFTEFGWNILQVVDKRQSGGVPFAEVRDGIRRFLEKRAIENAVVNLQEESDVVYFPVDADGEVQVPAPPLRSDEGAGG
jgi:peptidyl-prolyl cis-trans isomerase C